MAEARRYDGISGVRALACLGIVAMHVLGNGHYNLSGFFYTRFVPALTDLVFLFMTISGFSMCCGYYDRIRNGQIDIVDFYKKRYKKVLPFFSLLCLLDFLISPSLNSLYEMFANITLCFGLIPNPNISVIGVGWFLGTVFCFYLLFPFFCFLLAERKRAWIAFIAAFIMNYLCTHYFYADRRAVVYSFVYFFAGGIVFLYKDRIGNSIILHWINAVVIILLSIGYFVLNKLTIIIILLNITILLYSINISEKSILNIKPLKLLGDISFEVYLCHMFVYRIIENVHLLKIFSNDYINYLIIYIAVLAGAVIFALLGKWLINNLFIVIEKGEMSNG